MERVCPQLIFCAMVLASCNRFPIALERVRLCLAFKRLLRTIPLFRDGCTVVRGTPGDKGSERFVVARGGDGCHDGESNFPWTVAAEIEANRCLNTEQGFFSEALIRETL